MKKFFFTIDDNIRFLQELTEGNYVSLFSHPYTALLKRLHEKYEVKIQLNLFYENGAFTLKQVTDKFKQEWQENAEWLKLSFHSRLENVCPYEHSAYEEAYRDCIDVHEQISRFAGKNSLAKTTTIHYCQTTKEGLRALKDCGVQGLLGLYGDEKKPETSYCRDEREASSARAGNVVYDDDLAFAGIDVVLNNYSLEENKRRLIAIQSREIIKIMIHEQYFYSDYPNYQPDFEEKIDDAISFLITDGRQSCFFEEITALKNFYK